MRNFAFLAPLALTLAVAASAQAQTDHQVNVSVGGDLTDEKVAELGQRDVSRQADRLAEVVRTTLARRGALEGARIDLVLTDLKPNRPTMEQTSREPGLDPIRSRSIGGAAIEGRITTADGQVQPVKYEWFTSSLADSYGYTTWQDAERAYSRLADNLAEGRYVSR